MSEKFDKKIIRAIIEATVLCPSEMITGIGIMPRNEMENNLIKAAEAALRREMKENPDNIEIRIFAVLENKNGN